MNVKELLDYPQGLARDWLEAQACFLDTETTGLGDLDQVIEIGVVDSEGRALLNRRVRPTVPIDDKALAVHGIRLGDLEGEPDWRGVWPELLAAVGNRPVVMFNESFDGRLVAQSCAAHGLDATPWLSATRHCAMRLAIQRFCPDLRDRLALAEALRLARVKPAGPAHRALIDALDTRNLIYAIAAEDLRPRMSRAA